MQLPIEDHGVIGDLRTLALVGLNGTIDYLCWPRLDSPSVFASLLDEHDGGSFELIPQLSDVRRKQMYLPDTNVLLTRFLAEDGLVEVSDFMNVAGTDLPQRVYRRVKSVRGTVTVHMRCAPRFDYARTTHETETGADERVVMFRSNGDDGTRLRLSAEVDMHIEAGVALAEFSLEPGRSVCFALDSGEGTESHAADHAVNAESFKATTTWWRDWSARSGFRGRWRAQVSRSALALKLLTSAEFGSIAAAGTFGLPEAPGGARNWDYRYTWVRDAAFTVYGFLRVGHIEEAAAFMGWLQHIAEDLCDDGILNVMYRMDGTSELQEAELDHFSGYRGAKPVRIGNGAAHQLQLDIYGELMDAVYLADMHGVHISHAAWNNIQRMMAYVETHWQDPDEGIWEVRNGQQELLFSRLMCWVALDRGVRLARKRSLPGPLDRWRDMRDCIHEDIHANFWNEERQAFVQSKGGHRLDASCLLMPLVHFIAPRDPRWLSTLHAIGRELTEDSLVYRYSLEEGDDVDGLDGIEGTFNMCSFWYIECLARAGEVEQARFLFEKMLGYSNHLGLYAEQTGIAGEQLGNFPQAFTHLALISAAHCLDRLL